MPLVSDVAKPDPGRQGQGQSSLSVAKTPLEGLVWPLREAAALAAAAASAARRK